MTDSTVRTARLERLAFWLLATVVLVAWELLWGRFLPNAAGLVGSDYSYFLPQLLAGFYSVQENGWGTVPWFTPAFCGGLPLLPNPQSPLTSVPQLLTAVLPPLASIKTTGLLFAFAGFAGMHRLLREAFRASTTAALLGAALFALNGFFGWRMVMGHLAAHAFMLAPAVAWLLLRGEAEGDRRRILLDGVLAALPISYAVWSGAVAFLPPAAFAVLAVGLLHGVMGGNRTAFWARVAVAGLVAGLLSSAKLAAAMAYLGHFPRNDYLLPGASSLLESLGMIFQALFLSPDDDMGKRVLVNSQWTQRRHEFEFGVGLLPLAALVVGAGQTIARRARGASTGPGWRRPELLALVGVLALPVFLNWYTPGWNAVLKATPLLGSSSTLLRWLVVYLPLLVVVAALVLDRLPLGPRLVRGIALGGVLLAAGQQALTKPDYYESQRFDPSRVDAAWREARRAGEPPGVQSIVASGSDALAAGESPRACYEPLFGYRLEHYPVGTLHPGSPFEASDGRLNLKNPACYVFSEANGCAPGDHFRVDQQEEAAAFLRYRPFAFELGTRQLAANALTVLAGLGVLVFLAWMALRRGRREEGDTEAAVPTRAWPLRRPSSVASWAGLGVLVVLLGAIHGALVVDDPLLSRDDRTLVEPLRAVHSVGDYLDLRAANRIMDVQPVRDASFLLDLAVGALTGVGTFHLTNLLLWVGIVLLAWRILRGQLDAEGLAFAWMLPFALHPVFVGSVAWVSARKHLLATLFILAATQVVLRALARQRFTPWTVASAVGLYAASVFAQPITVLWPLWVVLLFALETPRPERRAWSVPALAAVVMLVAMGLNLHYYTHAYVEQGAVEKFASDDTVSAAVLALGRYFYNLVVPTALVTQYDPGSTRNVVGLVLLVLAVVAGLRFLPRRVVLVWGGFFLFPLAIVTVRMTNIFVSDTYLPTSAAGLLVLLGVASRALVERRDGARLLAMGLATLALVFAPLSIRQAGSWRSDEALWAHANAVEPTPNSLAKRAWWLIERDRPREAIELALRLYDWDPHHREAGYVLAKAVLKDAATPLAQRIAFLEAHPSDNPWFAYFLAGLHASGGSFAAACDRMKGVAGELEAFKNELPVVVAESAFFCQRAGSPGVPDLLERARSTTGWREEPFGRRARALGVAGLGP